MEARRLPQKVAWDDLNEFYEKDIIGRARLVFDTAMERAEGIAWQG